MLTFKLRNYADLNRNISGLLSILNSTPVVPALAPYIDSIPAEEIHHDTILQQQKEDKAQALPGAKEFRKAGVDLTLTIPDCPVSAAQLNAIAAHAATFQHSHMGHAGRFISYSHRANKWQINPAGNIALESTITKLTGPEEKTYGLTVQLFEHIAQYSPDLVPILFPEGKHSGQLQTEWLVEKIRLYRKK